MRLLLLVLALAATIAATAAVATESECPTFLQRFSHAGCNLFVWRDADDRLWVEPTFCVPDLKLLSGGGVCASYSPVDGGSYANVPLMLTNQTLLNGLAAQLSHLKPKSVKYLGFDGVQVSKITAWPPGTKAELRFEPGEVVWSQADDLGLLRLRCEGVACSVLENMVRDGRLEQLLDPLKATVNLKWPCGDKAAQQHRTEKLVARAIAVQGAPYHPLWDLVRDVDALPECGGNISAEAEVANVVVGNASCHLRLHRELGAAGLHAEPLLCYAGEARVVHDFNRGLHYVTLKLLLRTDPAALGKVASSPVTFMRLLDPGLADRGAAPWDLQLAADGDSMLVRVACDAATASPTTCTELLAAIQADPLVIFSRIKWRPTAWVSRPATGPGCRFRIPESRLSVPLALRKAGQPPAAGCSSAASQFSCGAVRCQFVRLTDGRGFLIAQQRRSASVGFGQNWTDYVSGFGDEHNFWIGLKNIDALTRPRGSLLRIEAKLWNGTELHAEYSRMRLQGSRYNLTYGRYLRHRSNLGPVDLLAPSRNASFMTVDWSEPTVLWGVQHIEYDIYRGINRVVRDHPRLSQLGNAGWWWSNAAILQVDFNPNGIFHYGDTLPAGDKRAFVGLNLTAALCDGSGGGSGGGSRAGRDAGGRLDWKFLKEVRLLLEV